MVAANIVIVREKEEVAVVAVVAVVATVIVVVVARIDDKCWVEVVVVERVVNGHVVKHHQKIFFLWQQTLAGQSWRTATTSQRWFYCPLNQVG